jgi:hypothetical protein
MIYVRLLIVHLVVFFHISYVAHNTYAVHFDAASQSDSKAVYPTDQSSSTVSNADVDYDESAVLNVLSFLSPIIAHQQFVHATAAVVCLYCPLIWSPPQIA